MSDTVMGNGSVLLSPAEHRGNVWRLALAQALAGANSVVIYATGAVLGSEVAPRSWMATLPISVFVVGMALCTIPAGILAERFGRKPVFFVGTGAGVITGLLAMLAMWLSSFWLLCASTLFGGAYAAVVLSFRFAATDGAPVEGKARALSLVMAGGVAAGVVGPQMVSHTMHLWKPMFLGTFLCQALVACISAMLLTGVNLPRSGVLERSRRLPVVEVLKRPGFMTAAICGAVSYLLMNFLMTAAPLAMHFHGHSQEASNQSLQWHVIAMYLPSFFTGTLISRFGARRVAASGLVLTATSALAGLAGTEVFNFSLSLILLGVGWNFGFLGASALVVESQGEGSSKQAQALNDFIVFGVMAVGSFLSGWVMAGYGWKVLLWMSLIPVLLGMVMLSISPRPLVAPVGE